MKKLAAILMLAIASTACTLKPQTLKVEPKLEFAGVQGIEIPISVDVMDKRAQPELLGYRNAKKEGQIGFNKPLADTLKKQIIKALQDQGATVGKTPEPATELVIEIHKLSYETPDESWVSSIEMHGELALKIKRGPTSLTKRFKANQSQDVITAPSEEFNETYLNVLLTTLVNKAMNDREVIGFIK